MRIEILEKGKDMFGLLYPGEVYTVESSELITPVHQAYTFWAKGYRFRIYQEALDSGKARLLIEEHRKQCECFEPEKYLHYSWCYLYGK